jgi:hypothetical protein
MRILITAIKWTMMIQRNEGSEIGDNDDILMIVMTIVQLIATIAVLVRMAMRMIVAAVPIMMISMRTP